MLKIEKFVTASPEQWDIIIEGMRNPKNSWDRMDSFICEDRSNITNDNIDLTCGRCPKSEHCDIYDFDPHFIIGENDHTLMDALNAGGPVHAKYRRMIPVWVTLTAPLYWWKEFDTYKVGTVANSCSTMHKIHAKEFTLEDFSTERLFDVDSLHVEVWSLDTMRQILESLNAAREAFLATKDVRYWDQMIQLLPSSYNQKRTIMLNYEVLVGIYKWRKNHKLTEWHTFCDWIRELPYSELIIGEEDEEVKDA